MVVPLSYSLFVSLLCALLFSLAHADTVIVNPDAYTFKFSQSGSGLNVWTAPATRRIRNTDTTVPTATGSTLSISAAMEELESFQVIIAPGSVGLVTVTMTPFSKLGSSSWIDIGLADFTPVSSVNQGSWQVTDRTTAVPSGSTINLSSSLPTVLWITVYVPQPGTSKGNSASTLTLTTPNGGQVAIPITLYVYDFVLEKTPHFQTYMDSLPLIETDDLDHMDAFKLNYLQNRVSLTSPDWPNGLGYNYGWNCSSGKLIDADPATSKEECIWANGCTMKRYALGKGGTWRGTNYPDWVDQGFPIYQAFTTDQGRKAMCGISCGNDDGFTCSSAYEQKFGQYLQALQNYFKAQGVDTSTKVKGFWYTQNEPQNWDDYTRSAYLCSIARKYAPGLPIMLSREAQAQIAERPDFNSCSYDIWMAHVWRYTATYTRQRQYANNEVSWLYSLDTDGQCASAGVCGPGFAPAVSTTSRTNNVNPAATNDGPHYRVIPWVAWSNRVTGWGYYASNIFWDTRPTAPAPPRPRITAHLLREGFEDYEYLYIANGNKYPRVYNQENADVTAISVGFAVGAWNTDPASIHAVRDALGKKIEGLRGDFPFLAQTPSRPFANYYIDFQNTANGAVADFSFGGKTWMAIGFDQYTVKNGYGWNSKYMGVPNTIQTGNPILHCSTSDEGNTIENTFCYDDYNHPDEFHFALAPGVYNVTVGLGWPGSCRDGDTEFIQINTVVMRNHTCGSCECKNVRTYSANVNVYPAANGGEIVMIMGNDQGYTVLNYMMIETTNQKLPPLNNNSGSSSTTSPTSSTPSPTSSTPSPTSSSTPSPTSSSTPSPSSTTKGSGSTTKGSSTTSPSSSSSPSSSPSPSPSSSSSPSPTPSPSTAEQTNTGASALFGSALLVLVSFFALLL